MPPARLGAQHHVVLPRASLERHCLPRPLKGALRRAEPALDRARQTARHPSSGDLDVSHEQDIAHSGTRMAFPARCVLALASLVHRS